MEGSGRMHLLLPMAICISAATLLLVPFGEGVPSPMQNHRFVYDIGGFDDKHDPHHRVRRKSGRGEALPTSACGTITAVPDDIRTDLPLDDFYQKYTHAYGIPIVSSSAAQDAALTRACYTVRFLLADRKEIRDTMYDWYGRVAVIAQSERTTQIPEHSHLDSDVWDDRARGLGGIPSIPVTTDGEENILCKSIHEDRWYEEDVLVHEFAHAIHLISLNKFNITTDTVLKEIYEMAKQENLWQYTYAISNYREYFAEGVQSFFNDQTCRSFIDNVHNMICTNALLKDYDPRLYQFIATVFSCMNTFITRCDDDQDQAANQVLRMDCDGTPSATEDVTAVTGVTDDMTNVTGVTDDMTNVTESATVSPTSGVRFLRPDAVVILTLVAIECIVSGRVVGLFSKAQFHGAAYRK